ncbi:MAG: outer membrane beta-barrel protein [Bacteroidota bacterium]
MKQVHQLFFFLFLTTSLYAQIEISGEVKDASNAPIEFANIVLMDQENKLVTGVVSDNFGRFRLSVNSGTYKLMISFIGYEKLQENITIDTSKDIGTFVLKLSDNKLNEVVLTSKKKIIEKKVDRLVFNVENSLLSSGGDLTDLLKVAPYLRIRNDEIIMLGKSGMRVLVDGNMINLTGEDLTNYLKSIPAEEIKRIEIITSPPAKYEAEGNSGLINIIYKKGIKNSWNSSIRGTYTQNSYPNGNVVGSFRYKKNKTSLYVNASYDKGSRLIVDTNEFEFDDQLWDNENPRRVFYDNSISTRIAFDYQWNKRISSGIQYQLGYDDMRIQNNSDETDIINKSTGIIDSLIISRSIMAQTIPLHSVNFHTTYQLDSLGKNIALNVDYFSFLDTGDRSYDSANFFGSNGQETPGSFNSGMNNGQQDVKNYSAKIDVEYPLKKVNLNFGGKLSFIDSNNDVRFFDTTSGAPILDLNQTNQFEYEEIISALYISASKQFNEKWSAKVGLRLENTETEGFSFQTNTTTVNDYIKLFPSMYINYIANENNIFSLTYNKRISRPNFEYLNPFRITQNPFLFIEGNPFLQPSFSDNVQFSFIHKQKWVNSLYFSKIQDGFGQIINIDSQTGVRGVIPQNYYDNYTFGLTESYTYNSIDWWESINTLNISYSFSDALLNFINDNRDGLNAYVATNNTFTLNPSKTITSSIDLWYSFPGVYDIYRVSSSSSVDISFRFLFLNKDLQLVVTGNDLFRTQLAEVTAFSNNVRTTFENYYDARRFRISLRYIFGNKKIRVRRKGFGNDEERDRT